MARLDGAASVGRAGRVSSASNWEITSDKPIDRRRTPVEDQEGASEEGARRVYHGGLGQRQGDLQLAAPRETCPDEAVDALELNFSCPHMDRDDVGSNMGKSSVLTSTVMKAVKEGSKVAVWCKLTPSTTDLAVEAGAAFRAGADAITSSSSRL